MKSKKLPISGFTLIEILISISVIFILLTITFAGYSNLTQKQTLVTSGQTLKNFLRDAQSRIYNSEMDCEICDCSTSSTLALKGWYVDLSTKQIYGECRTKLDSIVSFSAKPFDISSEISITSNLIGDKLFFRYYPPGVDQKATICLSKSNLANSYYAITVNQAGVISDSGGIVATCP